MEAWWLIIVACVMTVLVLIASLCTRINFSPRLIFLFSSPRRRVFSSKLFPSFLRACVWLADLLVYFQSEEDQNVAYAPKLAVILGLTLTCLLVLMLPLDVANRSAGGALPMELLWQIMYIAVAGMAIGVVPFMMFYYEAWDPESRNYQLWTAIKYEVLTVFVVGGLLLLAWGLAGWADVPLDVYSYNETTLADALADTNCLATACASAAAETSLRVQVSLAVWIIALVAFVGWFLFSVFVGVGLVALPLDLVMEYVRRPTPIDLELYAKQRMLLNQKSKQLMDVATSLGLDAHRKRDRATTKKFNQFRQAVYFLERDWNRTKTAYKERGGNPLKWMCSAFLGLIAGVLSVTWYIHIVCYVFISPPPTIFLNAFFIELDKVFSLFGTAMYGVFSFYLLACVLKGCMKVGLRFFWIPIHPMRIGGTMMNSFLFNVWLLLLCGVACVQFCYASFQSYAQLTAIDMLLGVQVRNLAGLSWFFRNDFFFYLQFGISGLTFLYLCAFPKDRAALDDD